MLHRRFSPLYMSGPDTNIHRKDLANLVPTITSAQEIVQSVFKMLLEFQALEYKLSFQFSVFSLDPFKVCR